MLVRFLSCARRSAVTSCTLSGGLYSNAVGRTRNRLFLMSIRM